MRPYVHQAQALSPGVPRLAHPKTRLGLAVFDVGVRLAARLLASGIGRKALAPPADPIELPRPWSPADGPLAAVSTK